MNWDDPIVADVRRTRESLSAKFDFDVSAIFADLRVRQTSAGARLVKAKRTYEAEQKDTPERAVGTERNG